VQYHGYGQKLTAQQCSDLEEENYELTKRIQELEGRQSYSLEEVAKIERQKYEELKQQLTDSQTPSEERINQLRNKIAHLEASRHQRLHSAHPEFQILRD
jgi:chromosome segregation ATPase